MVDDVEGRKEERRGRRRERKAGGERGAQCVGEANAVRGWEVEDASVEPLRSEGGAQ